MDPFSLLFLSVIGWWLWNRGEDAVAFVRREESPRIARQRARQQLAQQHKASTGRPTIGQAVNGRIAERIADRPKHGFLRPLREFLAERWADALADAIDSHRRRQDDRANRTDATPSRPLIAHPCLGECGRHVVSPDQLCPVCRSAPQPEPTPQPAPSDADPGPAASQPRRPDPAPPPPPPPSSSPPPPKPDPVHFCANRCGRAVSHRAGWCPACIADLAQRRNPPRPNPPRPNPPPPAAEPPPAPEPAASEKPAGPDALQAEPCTGGCGTYLVGGGCCSDCSDRRELAASAPSTQKAELDTPETPEPVPAPEPHQEGPSPMTAPGPQIISGDIGSPQEALAFCDGNLQVNRAALDALDTVLNNLAGEGVGQGFLDIIGSAFDALDTAGASVEGAREQYVNHVRVQADLLADDDLRDTVKGYLANA